VKILITAGPTREALDPLRFLSNRSSGKMGYALAETARDRGWEVTLISGPTNLSWPKAVGGEQVDTAEEMFQAVENYRTFQNAFVLSAAVADYRPAKVEKQKHHKGNGNWILHLLPTIDILAHLGQERKPSQVLAGFCLETENILERAREKLQRKKIDMILANSIDNFQRDSFQGIFLDARGNLEEWPRESKKEIAARYLDKIAAWQGGVHAAT
jgi:phosphopantothenoylcysteine decarboxylase/phosphopantothenate--cysteine ligase